MLIELEHFVPSAQTVLAEYFAETYTVQDVLLAAYLVVEMQIVRDCSTFVAWVQLSYQPERSGWNQVDSLVAVPGHAVQVELILTDLILNLQMALDLLGAVAMQ